MKKLKKFNIDNVVSEVMTSYEIKFFLKENNSGFIFQKNLERARHYSDLAITYLEGSYVCEKVAELGETRKFKIDWKSSYHPIAQFEIIPNELEKLHELIYNFCIALSGEDEEETLGWMEGIREYEDSLRTIKLKFPDLADDYFANLINGAYNEYETTYDDPEEFRSSILKQNPEHLFGFWKCMYSNSLQQDFYVSDESWIIPPKSNFKQILKKHSSIKKTDYRIGHIFSLNGDYYIITDNYILSISFPALVKALQCVSYVFHEERNLYNQFNWLYYLNGNYKISVSDFAGFVLFRINGYRIILWDQYKLTFSDINFLNKSATTIFRTMSSLIGLQDSITCDWTQLDDESFEELCYDIIYYDPRFDIKTIRKMGKSRSRDNGRDIVVYTHERTGYKPEKFIFQCKLIKSNSSLTATKVLDISDIIEQHEADGYGIFTSGVIDATLFDKIDKIASRRKLKTALSSKYELERDLAMLPQLKNRYFKIK